MSLARSVRRFVWAGCFLALGLVAPVAGQSQTFSVLANLQGDSGALPETSVTVDSAGSIYGETSQGGFHDGAVCSPGGCGSVYKIDPQGHLTTLVAFDGTNGASGNGNLTVVGDRLYGTTFSDSGGDMGFGGGLVFTVKTDGSDYRVLHRFTGTDGESPAYSLLVTPRQELYGVTKFGGIGWSRNNRPFAGNGLLYKIARDGTFSVLHYFSGNLDGSVPTGIVMAADGTIFGGTACGQCLPPQRSGAVIYAYSTTSGAFASLYTAPSLTSFLTVSALSPDGRLYGVDTYGGANSRGDLFGLKPRPSGKYDYRVLYSFTGQEDGQYPVSGPVLQAGVLYGTSMDGFLPNSGGTLYSFAKGTLTALYNFPGTSGFDPSIPDAAPTPGKGGVLYGTTLYGGPTAPCTDGGVILSPTSCGTVYRFGP